MGRHAFVNAWMSGIQGQNMLSGALTGGASSLGGAGLTSLNIENVGLLCAGNAVIGGTVSVIGGGKFANGAVTGAFTMLFNELAHDIIQKRENLVRSAERRWDKVKYAFCNIFVHDMMVENDMNPTKHALNASEWADESVEKEDWKPLEVGEKPRRGDIVAAKHSFENSLATGYMGIMLNSQQMIYAGGGSPYVVASWMKFMPKFDWVYYRYIGK